MKQENLEERNRGERNEIQFAFHEMELGCLRYLMSVTCNDGIEIGNIAVAFWEAELMVWKRQ